MSFPRPPTTQRPLEDEDISFILDATLRPEHRANAEVIRFILAYIACRSVPQAAMEARIPPQRAKAMMNRKDIHSAIVKITDTAIMKHGLDASEIVERVKEIAFFDPVNLTKADGSFIDNMNEIPAEARRAIKKFEAKNLYDLDPNGMPVVIGKLIKVEFWDKLKGNELLGREKNLFKETVKLEHDVTANMKELLLESKQRAEQRALESRKANEKPVLEITAAGVSSMPMPGPVKQVDDNG